MIDNIRTREGLVALGGGFARRRNPAQAVPIPPEMTYAAVLNSFNSGSDTVKIARKYQVHESVIYNLLATGDAK